MEWGSYANFMPAGANSKNRPNETLRNFTAMAGVKLESVV